MFFFFKRSRRPNRPPPPPSSKTHFSCFTVFLLLSPSRIGDVECMLSLQDDVQSTTAESPPSFKPPPPPGAQRHPNRRDVVKKCPSSESSHSGLFFTAPPSHVHSRGPAHSPASPNLHRKQDRPKDPSLDYTAIKKKEPPPPPKKDKISSANLATVAQHNIGPFPRAHSPSRGPKPAAPTPSPPPPPPLPAPPPPPSLHLKPASVSKSSQSLSPASKPQFVTVEVHRPNAEPDVNEVRPLPQARGKGRENIKSIMSLF